MKTNRIIIAILVLLLIILSIYSFILKEDCTETLLKSLPNENTVIGAIDSSALEHQDPYVFILKDNNEWMKTGPAIKSSKDFINETSGVWATTSQFGVFLDAYEELEAENFINQYETEGMEEAITLDQFKEELGQIDVYMPLDDDKKCRIMKRWLRKQKCKPKRKVYKQVVNKTKIGSISYKDGVIGISAPQIARFRNETNRINVLMELYYNLKSSNCDVNGFCYTNTLFKACFPPSDVIDDAYRRCTKIYTGELQNTFVEVLKLFYSNIEKFNDGQITEEQVKEVVNAKLDNVQQEITGAEAEDKKDGEKTDEENQQEENDSISKK